MLYFQILVLQASLKTRVTLGEEFPREHYEAWVRDGGCGPQAGDPAWETKKFDARKSIKMARKQLTVEVQGWDKMLSKYESRAGKGEPLTQVGRTLIASSAVLSQERVSTYLAVILSSLDTLMTISGNCEDDLDLDSWLDELLVEKESQTDVVAEGIDRLGDRTERLKAEFERKMEAVGGGASGGSSP